MPKNSTKKNKIKKIAKEILKYSYINMQTKIDTVLNSGAIDVDSWDPKNAPMIIPKCIIMAILLHESQQYSAKGTSYEKRIKKEVKNIQYFI